jgi:hypothetical protein
MSDFHIIECVLDADATKTNYCLDIARRGWTHHPDGKHWAICIASNARAVFYHPWIYTMTGSYRFSSEDEAHAAFAEMGWAK